MQEYHEKEKRQEASEQANGKQINKKKNKVVSVLSLVVIFLCVGVAAFSLVKVIETVADYKVGENEYKELSSFADAKDTVVIEIPGNRHKKKETGASETDVPGEQTSSVDTEASDTEPEEEPAQRVALTIPTVDFAALKAINPEVGGWISISGTAINYPVTFPDNNSYYVTHTYKKQENHAGCIFMDCRCFDADTGRNIVLYGHNMKNRTMFGLVKQYANQSWYDEHPTPVFVTEKETYLVLIFSAYYTNVSGNAWTATFESDSAYETWLSDIKRKSRIQCDVIPTAEDRVITLSTCSDATGDGRFVAHGVLVPLSDVVPTGD